MNLFNEEEPQENDIVRQISRHCKRLGNEADFNKKNKNKDHHTKRLKMKDH